MKGNTFIGVFLPYFLSELPDACVHVCVFKLFLLDHPVAEGTGERHGQNGEIGMNQKIGPLISVLFLSSLSAEYLSRLRRFMPCLISRPLNPARCISD
ncbi:MAG: hypothetical protein PF482_06825 [Desulfobacteraceae bacterium]|nr:hypothetical protein [Desulfobacteraceae bacterium]